MDIKTCFLAAVSLYVLLFLASSFFWEYYVATLQIQYYLRNHSVKL